MSFPDTGGFVCVLVSGGVEGRAVELEDDSFELLIYFYFSSYRVLTLNDDFNVSV
jgi:hypothetical protein